MFADGGGRLYPGPGRAPEGAVGSEAGMQGDGQAAGGPDPLQHGPDHHLTGLPGREAERYLSGCWVVPSPLLNTGSITNKIQFIN